MRATFKFLIFCGTSLLILSCGSPGSVNDTSGGVAATSTGSVVSPAASEGMVSLNGGTFEMGDLNGGGNSDELPVRSVTLSAFSISDHEVTASEYKGCVDAGGCTYSGGDTTLDNNFCDDTWATYNVSGKESHPVNCVSWEDTQAYITWLNGNSSRTYRLCTEAEWEYAARAGTTTQWSCGDTESCLDEVAWYGDNSGDTTHEVKTKSANAWGLYDMHGNVWEWVNDWFGDYSSEAETDPTGPSAGSYSVVRGGDFFNSATFLRSAFRLRSPGFRVSNVGFRLCSVL